MRSRFESCTYTQRRRRPRGLLHSSDPKAEHERYAMSALIIWLFFVVCNTAAALTHNVRSTAALSPFAFAPPQPPTPPQPPQPPQPYERPEATAEEKAEIQKELLQQVEEAQGEVEEALGGKPAIEQPEEEKEEKARSKGNFLTKIIEEASKIFAVLNIWYKYGIFALGSAESCRNSTSPFQKNRCPRRPRPLPSPV